MKKLLILIVGFLLSVAPAFSQSVITGTVMDAELNAPLSGANVIDIGGHKGETINFFLKNFNVNKIYVFEPNHQLFEILIRKFSNQNTFIIICICVNFIYS